MQKFLRGWQWLESAVAVVAFTLVAGALIVDVMGRELFALFNNIGMYDFAESWLGGVFGAQRFAVHATQIAGMLGFSIVVGTGGHLRPTVVDKLFPDHMDGLVNRVSDLISAGICAGLAWMCWDFMLSTKANHEISMVFQIEIWPFQLILAYVFASAAARYLCYVAMPSARPDTKGGDL
ncbi:MAG: TRAP transporter small permease subunit [Pseudomonadota bacterium]|nr:TRAP transporter small permease subunit [Pseudomonadota bacterium]